MIIKSFPIPSFSIFLDIDKTISNIIHTHAHIYISVCVCVCVCLYSWSRPVFFYIVTGFFAQNLSIYLSKKICLDNVLWTSIVPIKENSFIYKKQKQTISSRNYYWCRLRIWSSASCKYTRRSRILLLNLKLAVIDIVLYINIYKIERMSFKEKELSQL